MTKKRSVGSKQQQVAWLPTMVLGLLWGLGLGIFAWLATGIACQRDYTDLKCEKQDWPIFSTPSWPAQDVLIPIIFLIITLIVSIFTSLWKKQQMGGGERSKPGTEKQQNALRKILVTVAPILFLILAVAVLTVTFAMDNPPWDKEVQGIITGFGALFASVGALATVSVTYKSGEENRETQKEIEGRKQDAELIKTLNDRLHEIIPRRYGNNLAEISASYFQLAALYRDWETLAESSELVKAQKKSQQRNILKILFGIYQEEEENNPVSGTKVTESISGQSQLKKSDDKSRSQADIRILDSVIQDIFQFYKAPDEIEWNPDEIKDCPGCSISTSFDLSNLDLRGLTFSGVCLNGADLNNASLEGANLQGAHMKDAKLQGVRFGVAEKSRGKKTNMSGIHLPDADLSGAYLKDVYLVNSNLKGAILDGAQMQESILHNSCFDGAKLICSRLDRVQAYGARFRDVYLDNTYFINANLRDSFFDRSNMYATRLNCADMDGCTLEDVDMYYAHIENVKFVAGDLSEPYSRNRLVNQLKIAKRLPFDLHVWIEDRTLLDSIKQRHKKYRAEEEKL